MCEKLYFLDDKNGLRFLKHFKYFYQEIMNDFKNPNNPPYPKFTYRYRTTLKQVK